MDPVLLLDPSVAGLSGNMILGTLLDLGAAAERLEPLAAHVEEITGEEVGLSVRRVRRHGFAAVWMDWSVPEKPYDVEGPRFLKTLEAALDATGSAPAARAVALDAGRALVGAEAAVHDSTPEEVHFHELGSPDTLLDLAGTALLLEDLGYPFPVYGTAVAVGQGVLEARHGRLPIPPFVTLELLRRRGIPYRPGPADGELATPTGVALLGALVDGFEPTLTLRAEAVGYGAGTRELEGVPNVLRGVLGATGGAGEESVAVLETSLDDVSGEDLGHLARLLEESPALDFHLLTSLTKKNRPGYVLQVLARPGTEDVLADLVLRETGSLGVRITRNQRRRVLERETRTLRVPGLGDAKVRFKVARDATGRVVRAKPEYEDLREAAKRAGVSLREARRRAEVAGDALADKG